MKKDTFINEIIKARSPRRIGQDKEMHASVLIPLIKKYDTVSGRESIEVLFQVRSSKLPEQPGDICFPGGMAEEGETTEETAIRETREELLLSDEQIELIGPGDILETGKLKLHSYVGWLKDYEGSYSKDEVAEVFTVPLDWLLAHEPARYPVEWKPVMSEDFPFDKIVGGKKYAWRERKETQLFFDEYEGHVIWGITAKILEAFLRIIKENDTKSDC